MPAMRCAVFSLALLALALGCGKEHEELLEDFPVLPLITQAQLLAPGPGEVVPAGDDVFIAGSGDTLHPGDPLLQRVQLAWEMPDGSEPDSFRIYVGLLYDNPYLPVDTLAYYTSVVQTSYVYHDSSLALRQPDFCDMIGMCDSLYKYAFFRISAVTGGQEGYRSLRVSPSW